MLLAIIGQEGFDALTEQEQAHYGEKDGNFFLDVGPAEGLELADTTGLRSALQSERQNNAALKKENQTILTTYAGIDDPEKALEAIGKMDEIANWNPDEKTAQMKQEFEAQVTDKHNKELDTVKVKLTGELTVVQKKLDARSAQLRDSLVRTKASALLAEKEIEGNPNLLLPYIEKHIRMKELDDDTFETEVVDDNGTPLISTAPGSTAPMTMREFVMDLKSKPEFGGAFKGTGAAGSGGGSSEVAPAGAQKVISATGGPITGQSIADIASGKTLVGP